MQPQCRTSGSRTRGCTKGKSSKGQAHSSATHRTDPQDRPYPNTKILFIAKSEHPGAYTRLQGCSNQQLVAIGAADTSGAKKPTSKHRQPKRNTKKKKKMPTHAKHSPLQVDTLWGAAAPTQRKPRASNSKAAAAPCKWPQMDAVHNEQA